ncbi:MAG: phosphate acyltransferase PlsX [Rubrobacteraceae bacterium]
MRIAVDALGGDNAPEEIVAGTLATARKLPEHEFVLVGDERAVNPTTGEDTPDEKFPENLSTREAGDVVGMDEDPATALRSRPGVSVAVCAKLVRSGEADALFSAGNTGATVAAALMGIGRLDNCRRPAIATVLPLNSPVLLLDAGATISCRPQDLLNFAILGSMFAERYFGLEGKARVALVNVGEEPGKGNDLSKEAYALLQDSKKLRFVGNLEGRDLGSGKADVLVTDGFTGNVLLKTAEGVAREILGMVRTAVTDGAINKLAAGVLRPRLVSVRDQVDPENYGGSFLLGVKGTVVIGHGNSEARGVENALLGIVRTGSGLSKDLEEALASEGAGATKGTK